MRIRPAVAILLLSACTSLVPPAPPDIHSTWRLVDGTVDGTALAFPADASVTITFDADWVSGWCVCGTYGAPLERDGTGIVIGQLFPSVNDCPIQAEGAGSAYLDGLARATGAEVRGGRLFVSGQSVELIFVAAG